MLKNALFLALALDNESLELIIYDEIGINFYYLGDLEKSEVYHNKFMRRIVEPKNSYNRTISKNYFSFCGF